MRNQRGQALLEAVLVALILMVPILWGLTVLSQLHQAALASTAAVREAGTDAARSTDPGAAQRAVRVAVAGAFADQGLDPSLATVAVDAPAGLERGGTVEVRVAYPVRVFQAPLLGSVSAPVVWVRAVHVARIDPYRSRP